MTPAENVLHSASRALHSGDAATAAAVSTAALSRFANDARLLHVLGVALHQLGKMDEAEAMLRRSISLRGDVAGFHNSLGALFADRGRVDLAVRAFAQATRLTPTFVAAYENWGRALLLVGRGFDAKAQLLRALELHPASWTATQLLAVACHHIGDAKGIVNARRSSLSLRPTDAATHSDLLQCLHYDADERPEEIFQAHRTWAAAHADHLRPSAPAHRDRPKSQRLRIGYVSSGFCDHPISRFQEAILEHHDRREFEIFCYADMPRPDATTARIERLVDAWRVMTGKTDAEVAEAVQHDRIDILVDLHGHTTGNRLLTFARRPAPVQLTYNGYCDTTGMTAMDWRITDEFHDPLGQTEVLHTERLWRQPICNWCYRPDHDSPQVTDLPALRSGEIVFGCLNKPLKLSPPTLQLWARILEAIPRSRLVLMLEGDADVDGPDFLAKLETHGIPASRVNLVGRAPRDAFLGRFAQIDISLDPFPFNGVTTTCESLWMGVPVLTLAGDRHVSRAGVSLLTAVGLSELISVSEADYLRAAIELSSDLHGLAALRSRLRAQMAASPLCDGVGIAKRLESAYRAAWQDWVARRPIHASHQGS